MKERGYAVRKPAALTLLLASRLIAHQALASQTPEDRVAAHFRAGQEALKQGEPARARDEFKRVLALDPDLVEARINHGLVYNELGEYSLSASVLSPALRQRSNLPGPTVILGVDYLKLGHDEEAIAVLERALRLDPSNIEAHRALATCYRSREEFRQAAAAAAEFHLELQLDAQSAPAWLGLAETQLTKGDAESALDAANHVWAISPEFLTLEKDFPTEELKLEQARGLLTGVRAAPPRERAEIFCCRL